MNTSVVHFGCRLNQFESDGLKNSLVQNSHTLVEDQRLADFIVINTCTVTNKADYKNRAAIRRAHRLNPLAKIVVTGCYATTDAEDLRSLPGVYRVVSNDHKHQIAAMLNPTEKGDLLQDYDRFTFSSLHNFKSRATLKIQDGCNKSCSYCKIPQARGRGVSRNASAIIDQARELIDAGFGELVLTGVNIGWYEDRGTSFYEIAERILELPGNFHLRVSSIEPGDVNDRFAALYRHERMAKFLHIPLQSGSKYVLRMMRRGYTPENFMRRIEAVRRVNPDIHIGTDVIVGFPAEGEAEFQETLDLCQRAQFANIHIFPFSKRRNTPIVDLLERREKKGLNLPFREIHGSIIRARASQLASLKKKLGAAYALQMAGVASWAVVEKIEAGRVEYLTEHYLRGKITPKDLAGVRRGLRFHLAEVPVDSPFQGTVSNNCDQ